MYLSSRNLIHFKDDTYQIIRIFTEENVNDIDGLRDYLECDITLRKDGQLFFCQKIEDAEIVDTNPEQ
jgi:hypothetical protein